MPPSRCTRSTLARAALVLLALFAHAAGSAGCGGAGGTGKASAPVVAPITILDAHGALLVSIAGDGAITDARAARVGSFDAKASAVTTAGDQPRRIALAGAVTVARDRIAIEVPGIFEGTMAFEVRPDGDLLLGGQRFGMVGDAGSTRADRWRLAAGLVLVPLLPPATRSPWRRETTWPPPRRSSRTDASSDSEVGKPGRPTVPTRCASDRPRMPKARKMDHRTLDRRPVEWRIIDSPSWGQTARVMARLRQARPFLKESV